MDNLGKLCGACYGLVIICSRCNNAGLQPTVNLLDLEDCRVDSRSRGPDNRLCPSIEDSGSIEDSAERLFHLGYEQASEFYRTTMGMSSDMPSNIVILEPTPTRLNESEEARPDLKYNGKVSVEHTG